MSAIEDGAMQDKGAEPVDISAEACAVACMLVSIPLGEVRGVGWQRRVNDLIRAQSAELDRLRERNAELERVNTVYADRLCAQNEKMNELRASRERNAELENRTAIGWLYDNPDTGQEFSEQHPIESGEVDDAENVRAATPDELKEALLDAWRSLEDQRIDHDARGREAYARIASLDATVREMREALRSIETDARNPQIQYDKNGPQWTSKHSEFYDASYFLDVCNELADACAVALASSESVVKSEGEKDGESSGN